MAPPELARDKRQDPVAPSLWHGDTEWTRLASARCTPTLRCMIKNARFAFRGLLPGFLGKRRPPPATVARVDLDRLMGTWFEVARLPNLEADGPGHQSVNVTATYAKGPDGRITVQTAAHNAKAQMRRSEVKGTVHPADPSGAKLILRFFKLIRGDLWVIGLDPEYRWVLTGTPSRRRLWLIARAPRIEPEDYGRAMAIAFAQGYDAARVQPTLQEVPV
jgi:apolipoprotein D and lipocalin family protein